MISRRTELRTDPAAYSDRSIYPWNSTLRRGDGFHRSASPSPAPRQRGSGRGSRDTGPDRRTRALVWDRDGGACVACGKVISPGDWWSMQHRLARGQGGGNELFNLIVLCGSATSAGCHRRAEDRDREFNARGYWLHSWESPLLVPVMVFSAGGSGATAWLTEDGKYLFEAPAVMSS